MPHTDDTYEVLSDIDALERAEAIKKDPTRLSRIQNFAKTQQERIARITPKTKPRGFDGTVRSRGKKR